MTNQDTREKALNRALSHSSKTNDNGLDIRSADEVVKDAQVYETYLNGPELPEQPDQQ